MVSQRNQLIFWLIALAVFLFLLWFIGDTLMPFMLGAAVAYFLDPVADRLEAWGLSRVASTAVISALGLLLFVATILLIVPSLIEQVRQAVEAAPLLIDRLQALIAEYFPRYGSEDRLLRRALATVEGNLSEMGPKFVNSVLSSSLAIVDFVILIVVAPVVAFYLLLDWDRMTSKIDGWLPRHHAGTVREIFSDIDRVLAGFVRGQFTVCLILGTFYAVMLSVIGLPFGFLVGMLAGFLSFIPYVGSMTGGALSIGIALVTFWGSPLWIILTAAIFAFGQFVEGNILSPKLIGRSVGLHPVLLLLALSVFGSLFGFAGMLVAVPAAASLGVLSRFMLERYLGSALYTGTGSLSEPAAPGALEPPGDGEGGPVPPAGA